MSGTDAASAEKEAAFIRWMEDESRRREVGRLKRYLSRLEWLQLASYAAILFWVAVMFIGYQLFPEAVPADMAGIVTAVTVFGGAFIVWHLMRLKRETRQRIAVEMGTEPRDADAR